MLLNEQINLGVGKPRKIKVVTIEKNILRTEAYKERLLNRKPEAIEKEDIPIG